MSNPSDNEIEIDLTKAAEVLKSRYKVPPLSIRMSQDYLQAPVVVMTREDAPEFFVMRLKCDLHGLQMEKVEKAGPNRAVNLDVTENWELNQPVKAKFDEIREGVRKEAGRSKYKA